MSDRPYIKRCVICRSNSVGTYHMYAVPRNESKSYYIGQHYICDNCHHIEPDEDGIKRIKQMITDLTGVKGERDLS